MDILFWSGGKDSYLSYHFYKKINPRRCIGLLTTFNEGSDIIPHQELSIKTIKKQSRQLNLPLFTVPLPPKCPNEVYLEKVGNAIRSIPKRSARLIFGDRLAPEIINWREKNFAELGFDCFFPIQDKSVDELLAVLEDAPVKVRISAVREPFKSSIKVGQRYNGNFIKELPDEVDPMGEQGEFHTEIIFENKAG